MSFDDGDEIYAGFPKTWAHLVMATTSHDGEVVEVGGGPDGLHVKVKCNSLWGPEGNWLSSASNAGTNTDSNRKHTGLHNPLQPKQRVEIYFLNGNMQKPRIRPTSTTMYDKGPAT